MFGVAKIQSPRVTDSGLLLLIILFFGSGHHPPMAKNESALDLLNNRVRCLIFESSSGTRVEALFEYCFIVHHIIVTVSLISLSLSLSLFITSSYNMMDSLDVVKTLP
jgi:hypothetical protein